MKLTRTKNIVAPLAGCLSAGLILMLLLSVGGCATQSSTPADVAASAPRLTTITSVTAVENNDEVRVTITADNPLTFSSLKQPDPLAVVLYFPQTRVEPENVLPPDDIAMIRGIDARTGNGQQTARVEIQLAADTVYTAVREGNDVLVRFNRVTLAAREDTPEAVTEATAEQSLPGASPMIQAVPASTGAPGVAEAAARSKSRPEPVPLPATRPGTTAWLNKIDFFSEENGKSTVVVGTTHAVDYRIQKRSPKQLIVRLLNTRTPSYHQRPLITTRFKSAVDRVIPTQTGKSVAESVVSIEMREAVPYVAEQSGNLLLIHFEASAIPPKPLERADLPDWKQVISDTEAEMTPSGPALGQTRAPMAAAPSIGQAPMPEALPSVKEQQEAELQAMLGNKPRVYTGEKIALDFYQTDVKNVFRILREVSGKNFAIDRDVTGQVTMTLDKPVPWDQVLDLVLRMNQLGMAEEGQIIRIATLETLKAEDDLRKAKLESFRKAREEAKALEPLVTRYFPVSYSNADAEIKPHIENILTPSRGSVTVDAKNNQVIVTDTLAKIEQAEQIVRRIDKVTAQVIIEARVVEVTENFSRELGIQWDSSYGPGLLGDWETNLDMAMNFPSQAGSSIGINFSRLSGVPFALNARLNAVEATGEGKILSSPKILTLDNKKAKIKQGVEYPYLERDSSGGSSVKFKNIDLLLEVTPHVTPDDRISLIIFITKNDVAGVTAGVPSVATNEAETELLVNDGDTIVIGGIIKKSENSGKSGFPLLSKIPVLGWAFKNTTNAVQNNELLIFITPRIVQLEQVTALHQ